jgi:hypothetical protein
VKLDRLNDFVMVTTIMVIGIVLAILCGRFAGTGDQFWLPVITASVIAAVTCLAMRSKIWLLIPMFWSCSGQLNWIPGHFPLRDLVIMLVVFYFFTLKAFKLVHARPVYDWLDFILALNLLYMLATYLRNPVGVNAFGSDLVGGRAYLEIVFALGGYWVLNQIIITPFQAKILPLLLCIVPAFMAVVSTITYLFPATAPILGKLYSGIDAESYNREQGGGISPDEDVDSRAQYLSDVGTTMVRVLCSYLSPITLINPLYIWRFLLMCVAVFFCMKSGHRLTIPALAATVFLSTFFRRGAAAAIVLALCAIPPLVVLVAGQGNFYELPQPAQRALSILPGKKWIKWDPEVLSDAEGSTAWRTEMWYIVLHEEKYIHNKVFGDGFGFPRSELASMAYIGSQEDFMLTGDVHSGPISAIHAVGYVGLLLFILLLAACAIRSWRLIRGSKGTPFFPVSLLFGVQAIYGFFGWILIFGDFKNDLPNTVMTIACLNLIANGLAAYRKGTDQPLPVPVTRKTIQPGVIPAPAPVLH